MSVGTIYSGVGRNKRTTWKGEAPPRVKSGESLPLLFMEGQRESVCKTPERSVACSLNELMKERTKVKRHMAQTLFPSSSSCSPSHRPTSTRHQRARESH